MLASLIKLLKETCACRSERENPIPKLMVIRIIMSLGAVLLSTAPISQTFAQVKQQETQASGIAVEDTLSSSSTTESDNLRLLRPDATIIFPLAHSAAAVPSAAEKLSTAGWVVIVVIIAVIVVAFLVQCSNNRFGCG